MGVLQKSVEFTGVAGDSWNWDVGQEIWGGTFTIDFTPRLGDRDYQNEPELAAGEGVIVAQAQAGGSQIGGQIDAGAEDGVCRLVLVNGTDPVLIYRFAMPSPGQTFWSITYDFNSGDPIFTVKYNDIDQKVTKTGGPFVLAPVVGSNNISFGSRAGADTLPKLAIGGNARFYTTVLSDAQQTAAYDLGRAQDFATASGPAPEAFIQWGNGVGDTDTVFQDQTANNHDATRVGTWATNGVTRWDPVRHVGVWKDLSGNSLTEYVAGRTTGLTPNLSVSSVTSPSNAVRISGTPTAGQEQADYIRITSPEAGHRQWMYVRMRARTTGQVFGIGCVPYRQDPGVEATAVSCLVNLNNGISTIHTGEYRAAVFGTARVQSNIGGAGDVPVSGGGDTMPGTPSVDDIYGFFYQVDGNTITFTVRNETQDLAPVRIQHIVDNEIQADTLIDTIAQSGHPALFKLLAGDVDIVQLVHGDLTTFQPDVAFVCDSIANVNQDLPTNNFVGQFNEDLEASGDPDRWAVHMGRPGDRFEDAQSNIDGGIAARIQAQLWVLQMAANTIGVGAANLPAAEIELQAIQDDLLALPTTFTKGILHSAQYPHTFGNGVLATDWHVNQTAMAATSARAFFHLDTFTDLGDPTGTNNIAAGLLADDIHFNDTGAAAWEDALFTFDFSNTPFLGVEADIVITLADATTVASGTVGGDVDGDIVITLADATTVASGAVGSTDGDIVITLADATTVASGSVGGGGQKDPDITAGDGKARQITRFRGDTQGQDLLLVRNAAPLDLSLTLKTEFAYKRADVVTVLVCAKDPDPATGRVSIPFTDTDIGTVGFFPFDVQVTFLDNTKITFMVSTMEIRDDVNKT